MSRLAQLQQLFQDRILSGTPGCDEVILLLSDSAPAPVVERLGVYTNAYKARLIEIVANDHENLRAYMGEQLFDRMASEYVESHPSTTPNARWYSARLPLFLARTDPYRSWPQMAEIACLAAALNDAFDCEDAGVMRLEDLAAVKPEDWAELRFKPHPSVSCFETRTNALAIWKAVKSNNDVPAPEIRRQPLPVIVWRQELTPMVRHFDAEEAMLWKEGSRGIPFGTLCEMSATFDRPHEAAARVASYLAGWLNAGMLAE